MNKKKIIEFFDAGYVGFGKTTEVMGMPLKYPNMLMNGLLLYISLHLILSFVQTSSNFKSLISDLTEIPALFTISYSVLNTLFLYKTKSNCLNKVISQNFIYSTTLCIILLGYIENTFFISSFKLLIISVVTLWRIITPYINNFKNPIKHTHFLSVLSTNIVIMFYSTYFDYLSGIKTLGISIWTLLVIGSTFWQLYYLDMEDDFPFVGNTLKRMANKTREAYHKYYQSK